MYASSNAQKAQGEARTRSCAGSGLRGARSRVGGDTTRGRAEPRQPLPDPGAEGRAGEGGRGRRHGGRGVGWGASGPAAYSLLEVAVSSLIFSSPRSDRETEQHRRRQGAARTHQKLHHCYPPAPACRPRPGHGQGREVREREGKRRGGGKVESDLYPGNTKSRCPALERISPCLKR